MTPDTLDRIGLVLIALLLLTVAALVVS